MRTHIHTQHHEPMHIYRREKSRYSGYMINANNYPYGSGLDFGFEYFRHDSRILREMSPLGEFPRSRPD